MSFEPRLNVLKNIAVSASNVLKMFLFFFTFQVQFKNVLNFAHLKINEITCFSNKTRPNIRHIVCGGAAAINREVKANR